MYVSEQVCYFAGFVLPFLSLVLSFFSLSLSIYLSHLLFWHAIILSRVHIIAVRSVDRRNNWTATRVGRSKQGGNNVVNKQRA